MEKEAASQTGHLMEIPIEAPSQMGLLTETPSQMEFPTGAPSQMETPTEALRLAGSPMTAPSQMEPPMETASQAVLIIRTVQKLIHPMGRKTGMGSIRMEAMLREGSSFIILASGMRQKARKEKRLPGGRCARKPLRRKSPMDLACPWQNARRSL